MRRRVVSFVLAIRLTSSSSFPVADRTAHQANRNKGPANWQAWFNKTASSARTPQ